jgi:hypothetical protein
MKMINFNCVSNCEDEDEEKNEEQITTMYNDSLNVKNN